VWKTGVGKGAKECKCSVCVCGVYVWCEITKAGTRDMSRGEACAGRVLQRNQADHHIDIIIKKEIRYH